MILTLDIVRGDDSTQVSCALDGDSIPEFYGFDLTFSDADIETFIRADLTEKGYDLLTTV